MDIQRQAFENLWLAGGGSFDNLIFSKVQGKYIASKNSDLTDKQKEMSLYIVNSAYLFFVGGFKQAAKANAIPDGFVVVPRKSIEHWYLDEGECLWMDEPDNWLCDMDVGDVQEVEHKEYIVTESNTLYATKVWDGENQDVSSWEFFNSKDDAEKAAEYCKAMIEAQEPAND